MTALVVANDVTPGFGVPVAAPGLRAGGLAEGLRAHGLDVHLAVPAPILDRVWTRPIPPSPPPGTSIVEPAALGEFIAGGGFSHVVFSNANMGPHLAPVPGTSFVFDLFAPKVLELLASGRSDRDWTAEATKKERALALADHVFVNGRRKIAYALGWLLRPSVDRHRTSTLGLDRLIDGDPLEHVSLVEMPVPLPEGIDVRPPGRPPGRELRVGVAGYTQPWSGQGDVSPAIEIPRALGHHVHVLTPPHWGRADAVTPTPIAGVTQTPGPLDYPTFATWLQTMDVVADHFAPSAERRLAMVTRTTVALRLGIPVIHGADSEVSDLIEEYDAGWVVDAGDEDGWGNALSEASDADRLAAKQRGAVRLSSERFEPGAALATAAKALGA